MAKPVINQFNGGEISPWLEGRIDLAKYAHSARIMRNFIPLVEGSVIRRGGSHFVKSCKEVNAVLFKIVAVPSEAEIYINNEPGDELYCPPGETVSYTVSLEGYETQSGTYTVTQDTELTISLLSQEYKNTLTISTVPSGAQIFINGLETSSAEVVRGSTAYYHIEKTGYDAVDGKIQVMEDTSLVINLAMTFEIRPTPEDAVVTINGTQRSKVTAQSGDVIVWSVAKSGYETQSGTYTITETTVKYVDLVNTGYELNQVVFEKGDAGTFIIDLLTSGYYDLSLCSAGGGGGGSALKHNWVGGAGGSGAAYAGKVWLNKATYAVKIGKGGAGGSASGRNALNGQPAFGLQTYYEGISIFCKRGDSSIQIYMTPGLGGSGTGAYSSTAIGGVLSSFSGISEQSHRIRTNGKAKSTVSILGNGYGAGGKSNAAAAGNSGTNGYCKLVYLGQA